jgi:hypothetical protein
VSYLGDCARVYGPHGKLAHLLSPADSPNSGYPGALCGVRRPLFASWLGTGSQGEREKAAGLPLCSRCQYLAAQAEVTG